jgi:cell wall-associated NlpC family hydrolase
MIPADIVAIAREVIGSPYGHQGRVGGIALDCAGVPVYVAQRLGMPFDDVTGYGRQPNPDEMRAILEKNLARVAKANKQPGDVVWLKIGANPQHLGVLGDYPLGGLSLIHSTNGSGLNRVVEHRLDDAWCSRIVAVWRFPQVAE